MSHSLSLNPTIFKMQYLWLYVPNSIRIGEWPSSLNVTAPPSLGVNNFSCKITPRVWVPHEEANLRAFGGLIGLIRFVLVWNCTALWLILTFAHKLKILYSVIQNFHFIDIRPNWHITWQLSHSAHWTPNFTNPKFFVYFLLE